MAFVNAALSLFGMDLSIFGLEETSLFTIKEYAFQYTAGSGLLTADEAEQLEIAGGNFDESENEDSSDDYFECRIKTDICFGFQNKFGMEEIGFRLEKYGSAYDLALEGVMAIFGAKCPFFISYGNECFSLSLSQCGNVELDNVDDMGLLSGEANILGNFPADFKPSGKILLNMLNLKISSDFKHIICFHIAVLPDYRWQLCKSPDLQLSGIVISFSYHYGQKCFGMTGQIRFCEIDSIIGAAVIAGEEKPQWQFSWRMYDNETISLTEFLVKLADSLGVSAPQMGLPEVGIGNVAVEYAGGAFTLQLMILVSNSGLFSSEMSIEVQSSLKDGRRNYIALFSWLSTSHMLTVGNVLSECGLGSAVSRIPDFIRKIGLNYLELHYDFLESRIDCKIEVQNIGTLDMTFVFHGDKAYLVKFTPAIEEISLADLPVVGTLVKRVMPPSSDFSISGLRLNIGSGNVEGQISEGVGLEFSIMGEKKVSESESNRKMVWLNVQKTLAIFTLHRIGVGFDGTNTIFAADASLQVSPLSFTLMGAGLGLNLSDPEKIKFYITGFGISFQNGLLSVSGGFVQDQDGYSGELLIRVKQISVSAIAEYSSDGSLMAFAAATANFGDRKSVV